MAAKGDKIAIRELMDWRQTFSELDPPEKQTVRTVNFVNSKGKHILRTEADAQSER
jgi:hypothetical protein